MSVAFPGKFSLCDLSRARGEIFSRLSEQAPRPSPGHDQSHTCVGCGALMEHPTLRTADAGQAYEVVPRTRIEEATTDMFSIVSKTTRVKDPTVSVMHRTKAVTAVGGRIDDMLCDRTVFFASKVKTCIQGLLDMRTFRIGNLFLRQVKGIPIGGPISGALLDLVLARAECIFDFYTWPKVARTWNLAGPRNRWITFGRYVDDIIAISRWLCPCCVMNLLPTIYKGLASFDESNDGLCFFDPCISVKFLDLWFYVSWSTCETSLIVKNNLFAYTGKVQFLAKNRFPVPTGDFLDDKQRLVSDFKGRLARFRQIESSRS